MSNLQDINFNPNPNAVNNYTNSKGQPLTKSQWTQQYGKDIAKEAPLIAANNMANGRFGNNGGYGVNAYGAGKALNPINPKTVASFTGQYKPVATGIPDELQTIFNTSPYLTEAQRNDMVSIWTSNQSGKGEPATRIDGSLRYTTPGGYGNIPLKSGVNSLFNPQPTSAMSKIFTNKALEGNQRALSIENKDYIKALSPSKYEMARMLPVGTSRPKVLRNMKIK